MINKLFTACAAVAMMTGSALALDLTGTYTGQSNGQDVSVQLQERDGVVRGSVRVNGAELPLAGQERDGQVRGVWQNANGQQIPFAARVNNGRLELATNGVTYSLAGGNGAAETDDQPRDMRRLAPEQVQPMDREPQPQQDPRMMAPQDQQPMRPMTVRMEQGQIFARPVPDGWKGSESSNETCVVSPDATMAIGFTGYEGVTPMSPTQFMQWMMVTIYKNGNFQILQQKEVASPGGGKTVEAVVTYTNTGHPCKAWIRCNVLTAYNSSNGYMLFASAVPEKFDNAAPMLVQMAEKIQITDVNAVFDRAHRLGVIQSVKNNPIPDTIIVGYEGREKIMDGISFRRGEADTDTYHVTTNNGEGRYVGNQAIDPNLGGYRDPRTGEVYKLDPRWNGHY